MREEELLKKLEEVVDVDITSLLNELAREYKRKVKRLDVIVKQSDKQQAQLLELNKEINEHKNKLSSLYEYDKQQQLIAKEKLDANIINDLVSDADYDSKIIFHPSDILSGDFYSVLKLKDGSVFAYVLDGQGHGVSPALSVFATSSTIHNIVKEILSLSEIVDKLFPAIEKFLGDIEQLSYTMILIHADRKTIDYSSGGMYPFMVKTGNNISKYKANNLPFMSFFDIPVVTTLTIENWDSLIIYSDGIVEDEDVALKEFNPENILEDPTLVKKALKALKTNTYEDDITVVYINKIESLEIL